MKISASGAAAFLIGTALGSLVLVSIYWIIGMMGLGYEPLPDTDQVVRGIVFGMLFLAGLGVAVIAAIPMKQSARVLVGGVVGFVLAVMANWFGGMPQFLFGATQGRVDDPILLILRSTLYVIFFGYMFSRMRQAPPQSAVE